MFLLLNTHSSFGFGYVQINRKDLTDLKVYAIDVDEADEVFNESSYLLVLLKF